jgi:hypothetical protein
MITALFGAAPGAIDVDESAEFLDHSLPKATLKGTSPPS